MAQGRLRGDDFLCDVSVGAEIEVSDDALGLSTRGGAALGHSLKTRRTTHASAIVATPDQASPLPYSSPKITPTARAASTIWLFGSTSFAESMASVIGTPMISVPESETILPYSSA